MHLRPQTHHDSVFSEAGYINTQWLNHMHLKTVTFSFYSSQLGKTNHKALSQSLSVTSRFSPVCPTSSSGST